jgi:hypothetical protein
MARGILEFEYDEGQDEFLLYALLELVEEKEQRIRHILARLRRLEYVILTFGMLASEVFTLELASSFRGAFKIATPAMDR